MFGESLKTKDLKKAFESAAKADLAISIGSTLTIEPAASIPLTAKENGAPYIIVNVGSTAHDSLADIKIEGDATEILPLICGR